MAERFGFWIVSGLAVAVLAVLYFNADRIPQAFEASSPAAEQAGLVEAQRVPAEAPDLTVGAGVSLSITTDPVGAAIFADGDYVGTSPLRDVTLPEGRHLISVQKPDYAQLDTFVTLHEAGVLLELALREAETPILAEDTLPISEEDRTPSEEEEQAAVIENPVSTDEASLAAVAEAEQPVPEQTPLPPTPEETPTEADQADIVEEEAPAVPVGELRVVSQPAGASVWMAGQAVGVTPLLLSEVQAGPQQITLRLDGYDDFTTAVDVVAQQRNTVSGQLKQRLGTLKILVRPWGAIYIDGALRKEESTVWYTTELTAGNHRVRVVHPSLGNWEQVVVIPAGEEHAITIDFNKRDSDSQE